MNKTYRIVWNAETQRWVVASELAKSRKKSGATKTLLAVSGLFLAAGFAGRATAANGIYINGATDSSCLLVSDNNSTGTMMNATGTGCTAYNTQTNGVLFYGSSATSGTDSLSIGNTLYVNSGRIVLGDQVTKGLMIGDANTSAGNWAVAIGLAANAAGGEGVAIGSTAVASGGQGVAIGARNIASGGNSTALGNQVAAAAEGSIAIGGNAESDLAAVGAAAGTQIVAVDAASEHGIAIGTRSQVINSASGIAMGRSALASNAANGIAMGNSAKVTGTSAVAVGYSASAVGQNDVALGASAIANSTSTVGSGATALGFKAEALAANSVAIGNEVTVLSGGGIAIVGGQTADFHVNDAIDANSGNSIVMGTRAQAITAPSGIALGNLAKTMANSGIAIGVTSAAYGANSISLGSGAGAVSDATAISHDNIGIGTRASNEVKGDSNTAMGFNAGQRVTGSNNTALGTSSGTNVTGGNNFAQGYWAGRNVTGDNNIAMGAYSGSYMTGSSNIVMGDNANSGAPGGPLTVDRTIALGSRATAIQNDALAIGSRAYATAANAIAIGSDGSTVTQAQGNYSIAIGSQSAAMKDLSLAVGKQAGASGVSSTAIGEGAKARATGASALGSQATAAATNGTALGTNAHADVQAGDVALGANSVTATVQNTSSATINGTTYKFAGSAATSTVSVGTGVAGGERTITNVGAGRISGSSTDAINGSQLDATNRAIDTLGNTPLTFAGNTGTVTKKLGETMSLQGAATTVGTYSGANLKTVVDANGVMQLQMADAPKFGNVTINNGNTGKITGVTAGEVSSTSTDAINGSQLHKVEQIANAGWNISAQGANATKVAPGETVDLSNTDGNLVVKKSASSDDVTFDLAKDINVTNLTVTGDTHLGNNFSVVNNEAYYDGPITKNTHVANKQYVDQSVTTLADTPLSFAGNTGSVAKKLGETMSIQGTATTAGTYSGANLKTLVDANGAMQLQMADAPKFGNVTINDGNTGKITGVTAGEVSSTSTDAINGSQLHKVEQTVNAGWNISAQGANATKVAPGETVDLSNTDGNLVVKKSASSDDVTFDLAKDINVTNLTVTGDTHLGNNFSVVNNEAYYDGPITNNTHVANKQYVDQSVKTLADTPLTFAGNTGSVDKKLGETMAIEGEGTTAGTYSGANLKTVVDANGVMQLQMADAPKFGNVTINDGNTGKITGVTAGEVSSTSTDAINGSQLHKVEQTANAGWNISAQGANTTKVAPGETVDLKNTDGNIVVSKTADSDDVTFDLARDLNVASVTMGGTVLNQNGLTIVNGPSITTSGIDAGGKKITNVAEGADPTDAVNVSQLKKVEQIADAGWNISAQGANTTKVAPGETVDLSNTDGNLVVKKSASSDDVTFDLAKDINVTNLTVTGDTHLGNNFSVVNNEAYYDGPITKNTHVANKQYVDQSVKTLADTPLSFKGNTGSVDKKLGETMAIEGEGTTAGTYSGANLKTAVDANGVLQVQMAESPKFGNVTINDGNTGKITGVTAGEVSSTSTDAINGSQLHKVEQTVNAGWNISAQGANTTKVAPGETVDLSNTDGNLVVKKSASSNDVTFDLAKDIQVDSVTAGNTVMSNTGLTIVGGPSVTIDGINAGNKVISNVAPGVAGTDAVNVNQLNNLGESTAASLGGSSSYDPTTQAVRAGLSVGNKTYNNVQDALNQVNDTASAGWNVTDSDGKTAKVGPNGKVTFKGDSNVKVNQTGADDEGVVEFALNNKLDLGADGSLTMGNTVVNNNGLTIVGGPSVTVNGIDAGGKKITNVANGTDPTDAVNVSQLTSTVEGARVRYHSVNDNGVQHDNYNNEGATGVNAMAVGVRAVAAGASATALGDNAKASHANGVALGAGSVTSEAVATTHGTINGKTYDYAGAAPTSTVSVGSEGNERTITNVAAGRVTADSTDAINGSQLYATNQAVEGLGVRMTTVENTVNNITENISNITTGQAGMFQTSKDATAPVPTPSGKNSAAGGSGATAAGDNSLAVGNDSKATADNSVALGNGSVADRANTVSVGSAGNERQVTNVAAGVQGTDAVNVSQLKASESGSLRYDTNVDGSTNYNSVTLNPGGSATTIQNVQAGTATTDAVNVGQLNEAMGSTQNWAKSYTDRQINTVAKKANAGTASAMATASVPQAYQPNQSSVGVGVGNYQGQSAIAIGVSTISESGRYILKASATGSQKGDFGVGVGAGMVW